MQVLTLEVLQVQPSQLSQACKVVLELIMCSHQV